MKKIVTIMGTRPEFVKAAVVTKEIAKRKGLREIIVHTGQHFDAFMSDIFFKELKLPRPRYYLGVNRLSHGAMTGRMLERIEGVLVKERPDIVIVYGDADTTLAGALAAKKLNIKLAHIEAGLRSFNMTMPEEINRILTDRISDLLFCPTPSSVKNLKEEKVERFGGRIIESGDVMKEAAAFFAEFAKSPEFRAPKEFALATVHRAENTDNPKRLRSIFNGLGMIAKKTPVVMPLHPRTRDALKKNNIRADFIIAPPLSYLEMLYMIKRCALVITDSGGLQKEAFFFRKPCVTLREETEWVELVKSGMNLLAGSDSRNICRCFRKMREKKPDFDTNLFGKKRPSAVIVKEFLR